MSYPGIEGKVAIVTGGSRGIGKSIAQPFVQAGAQVMITSRKAEVCEAAAKEIGEGAHFEAGHVGHDDDAERVIEATMERLGRVDILVNNAAIFLSIQRRPFYELTPEEWDEVTSVNIKGPFLCAKAVFPQMKIQGSGKIINISSTTALAGTPLFLHYVTSKAALMGMTRALAREVGGYGICVNAIAPGLVEHEGQTAPKEFTEFQLNVRTLKRLETPDDLNGTLVYLASSDSDFVTGQTIIVDGGSVFH